MLHNAKYKLQNMMKVNLTAEVWSTLHPSTVTLIVGSIIISVAVIITVIVTVVIVFIVFLNKKKNINKKLQRELKVCARFTVVIVQKSYSAWRQIQINFE